MKLDVSLVVCDVGGEPLKRGEHDLLVRDAIIPLLMSPAPDVSPEQKMSDWDWAVEMKNNDIIKITIEQAARLKDMTGKRSLVPIQVTVWNALEKAASGNNTETADAATQSGDSNV